MRTSVLEAVADRVLAVRRNHPVRVGVDGRTAAGKTTFATSLAALLRQATERRVIHVGIDYFKRMGPSCTGRSWPVCGI